jgi:16S rRNA processing protein RimM
VSPEKVRRQPEFILIGRILGTFGWAGEVKVKPETDFPQRFKELVEVIVESPQGSRRTCHIQAARVSERQIRLKFAEYSSKEEAAALRGSLILVPAEQLVSLPENNYFLHQILGLSVQSTEGEDLGKITEIIRAPAHDVYVTPKADLPARKEVVKTIDLEKGIMLVDITGMKQTG